MFDMDNSQNEIKIFLKEYFQIGSHLHNSIIRYYTDQFLSGKINSQKLYSLLQETGVFQPGKNITKIHQSDDVDTLNSDNELKKIIRTEIYQNVTVKVESYKNNPQSRSLSARGRRKKRSNRSFYNSAPKKIVTDDPKIKMEIEATNALLEEFEKINRNETELVLKSKIGTNLNGNNPRNTNPLNLEEKEALQASDQYRNKVNDKQKMYWGSS